MGDGWKTGPRTWSLSDFEYLTDKANVIWAASFLLFPIGSWFFLYDKKMSLKERAEARGVRPPGYFSQELICTSGSRFLSVFGPEV